MATAAFDPTAGGGTTTGPPAPPSTGADDLRVAEGAAPLDGVEQTGDKGPTSRRVGTRWDVAAALVRALAIVLGVTATAWALARRWPTPTGDAVDGVYGRWLVRWLPVPRDLADAAAVTAQLAVVALAVAIVGGLALALVARWRRLTRPAVASGILLAALAGPALAVTARYWLIERRGLAVGPGAGAVTLASSWRRAVDDLLLPAAAAGLPAAPALAALFTSPRPGESRRWTGLASPLADRAPLGPAPGPGPARPVGLPVAVLLAGVAGAEVVFGRPGLFARLAERPSVPDPVAALDAATALALGFAATALIVDLVALALTPMAARRRSRRPEPRAGTETLFATTGGPAVPSARAVRVAVVLLAGLVVGGLVGAVVAPHPGPTGGRRFGPPLLDGVLGSDGAGRDLLALTASALGRAVAATAGAALLAAVVALALAPVVRRLARAGRLVPGALVDALWAPAGVLAVVALPTIGGEAGLLHPLVLVLTGLALVPMGLRLAVRTAPPARVGRLLHALALWLLLAPLALTAHLVAGFLGPADAGGPTLGQLLAGSLDDLGRSPWPTLWPIAASGLLAAGCTDLGSSLAALARQRAGRRPDTDDEPWALSMNAVHDERPWYDGQEAEAIPSGRGTTPTADEPPDGADPPDGAADPPDAAAPPDGADPLDAADAAMQPARQQGLSPNFDLQPGLPPPALQTTMRLPVVRVRLADPDGPDPDGPDPEAPEGVEDPG